MALGILATVITTSTPVFAATNTSTSNVGTLTSVQANTINSDTVITEDNMSDVLKYIGLNPSDVIEGNETGKSIGTVGELQKSMKQAKKQQNKVITKTANNKLSNATTKLSNANIVTASYYDDEAPTDSQRVYHDTDFDGYVVEFSCDGDYRHGQWCGVSGEDATITSGDGTGYFYKITAKNDLSATYTSSRITMHHKITVKSYVGVGKFSVCVNTNTIKGYDYFNIEDWV